MNRERILIFAGTTEGRKLFDLLVKNGVAADISVATEYGRDLINGGDRHIYAARLTPEQMAELLQQQAYTLVIDATHPYATEVTANIQSACKNVNVPVVRLLRAAGSNQDVIACPTIAAAVKYLEGHEGNVLSTIGSKELRHFTRLEHFAARMFARILPLPEAVTTCYELGFKGSNLICMQGPFGYELNLAMLKQYNCQYLLTKDSGKVGGFEEKVKAAQAANAKVILIERPQEEHGLSFAEVIKVVEKKCQIKINTDSNNTRTTTYINNGNDKIDKNNCTSTKLLAGAQHSCFPLFINIKNKHVLVAGGGVIATRRVKTLCKFDCRVKVVAPQITDELTALATAGSIDYEQRPYTTADLNQVDLVVAATNNREVNRQIGNEARARGLYVSVADRKEECNFYFPAIIDNDDVVIGITSQGKSHKTVSGVSAKIRGILQNED